MNILPIWQQQGDSTHEIARKLAEKHAVKTSHTGTLDPMAEGVIIVLLGEERLKKYEYAKWPKIYEFEIVFGISTDTFDGMGLITDIKFSELIQEKQIARVLGEFVGNYTQKVPIYSTKKIKGKHLHEYARKGENVEIPEKSGEISTIQLQTLEKHGLEESIDQIINKISKISGDFRQQQIIDQWSTIKEEYSHSELHTAKIEVKMTKGLYVRSLSQDICAKLNTLGFAHNIVRTANGQYTRENSIRFD